MLCFWGGGLVPARIGLRRAGAVLSAKVKVAQLA